MNILPHISEKKLDEEYILEKISLEQGKIWQDIFGMIRSKESIGGFNVEVFNSHIEGQKLGKSSFFANFSVKLGGDNELMKDLMLMGYSRNTNFTFSYDYTLVLFTTDPPADMLYAEVQLGVVCDETVMIDGVLKKDHIQARHCFKIKPEDFVSWESQFTIRGLCVNKFYSSVREAFYERIIKTLSN